MNDESVITVSEALLPEAQRLMQLGIDRGKKESAKRIWLLLNGLRQIKEMVGSMKKSYPHNGDLSDLGRLIDEVYTEHPPILHVIQSDRIKELEMQVTNYQTSLLAIRGLAYTLALKKTPSETEWLELGNLINMGIEEKLPEPVDSTRICNRQPQRVIDAINIMSGIIAGLLNDPITTMAKKDNIVRRLNENIL